MDFKERYQIKKQYLTNKTKRRCGQLISPAVKFIVAHDTGNPGSTAQNNVSYYERTSNEDFASAHLFIDDKEIIECIPALSSDKPEKAWHVRYDRPEDNKLFGFESNDVAISVEYCYGNNINADEAYRRYIWILASLCCKFKLNPAISIAGHFLLDPGRKTDPVSGLKASGRTYDQLLQDVVNEYNLCINSLNINLVNTLPMKLIKNSSSNKIYTIGADNKKHWIFNEATFNIGKEMGLWSGFDQIEIINDDGYEEGHTLILVK